MSGQSTLLSLWSIHVLQVFLVSWFPSFWLVEADASTMDNGSWKSLETPNNNWYIYFESTMKRKAWWLRYETWIVLQVVWWVYLFSHSIALAFRRCTVHHACVWFWLDEVLMDSIDYLIFLFFLALICKSWLPNYLLDGRTLITNSTCPRRIDHYPL